MVTASLWISGSHVTVLDINPGTRLWGSVPVSVGRKTAPKKKKKKKKTKLWGSVPISEFYL